MMIYKSEITFSNPWDDCHHFEANCYAFRGTKTHKQTSL